MNESEGHFSLSSFCERRVLIVGLGVQGGGVGVARFMSENGAQVRVTDAKPASQLQSSVDALRGEEITFVLGEHRTQDVDWAEIVVRNPGVPESHPLIRQARDRNKAVLTEMNLFMDLCPATVIGVTGTKGKTTTATIAAHLIRGSGRQVHLAGNMGISALEMLPGISPPDIVVLELSSFQLESFDEWTPRPRVSIITNIGDDHMDRYDSPQSYIAAKVRIAQGLGRSDWLILPADNEELHAALEMVPARRILIRSTSSEAKEVSHGIKWATVEVGRDRADYVPTFGQKVNLIEFAHFPLRGEHNRTNASFAAIAAYVSGAYPEQLNARLASLQPLRHRTERIASLNHVTFVNDTTATTPMATVATLDEFREGPLCIIMGGHDKRADYVPLVEAIKGRQDVRVVLLRGSATQRLEPLLRGQGVQILAVADSMFSAVKTSYEAVLQSSEAGTVLLSPAAASFGMFENEFDRGDRFRQSVAALGPRATSPE